MLVISFSFSFFLSPDGEAPSEDEVRKMVKNLHKMEKTQRAIDARKEEEHSDARKEEEHSSAAGKGESETATSAPADPFSQWPPLLEVKANRYEVLPPLPHTAALTVAAKDSRKNLRFCKCKC